MLAAMRSSLSGPIAKIFAGLLALSFAIWGVSDILRVKPQETLIAAGETTIDVSTFSNRFRNALQEITQRTGRAVSPDEARQMGLDRQILRQLVREAVLKEAVRRLGLSLSDEFIARRIKQMPQFRGPDGRFDRQRLLQALYRAGMTEGRFLNEERTALLGNGVMEAVSADMPVPQTLIERIYTWRNAARDADYVEIVADEAALPQPDETTLKKFYEENKQLFSAPERRVIKVLALLPAKLLDKVTVEEKEIKQLYEANKARFFRPERRTVEQLRFASEEEAKKALDALKSGAKTWEGLLAERNLKPKDVRFGPYERKSFPDEELAKAVFATREGALGGPVKTPLGVFLFRVVKVEPAHEVPFEKARDELAKRQKLEKARDLVAEYYDKIEEARASGQTLADVAQSLGLKLETTPPVALNGTGEDGKPVPMPGGEAVLGEAFRSEPGADNDVVELGNDGYAWFEVEKVIPAGPIPFDKAREEVLRAWKARALAARLRRRATEWKKKAEAGMPLAKIAEELGVTVKHIEGMKRNDARPDFPAAAVHALFAARSGHFALAISADGRKAWLMKVKERPLKKLDPASSEANAIRAVLTRDLAASMGAQFIGALQKAYDVKINMKLWQKASGAQ